MPLRSASALFNIRDYETNKNCGSPDCVKVRVFKLEVSVQPPAPLGDDAWIHITSGSNWKLDVDPRRDDDASPMSSYRCLLRLTWMISSLRHKSKYKSKFNFDLKKEKSQTKYKSKFNFEFFEKKKSDFMFPCCSTREDFLWVYQLLL